MARGDKAFPFDNLLPYYRGAYYATVAIKSRLAATGQIEAAREVSAYQAMITEFEAAIKETYKLRHQRDRAANPPTSA